MKESGSGLSLITGLPMAGHSQSWGRQEHPRETGTTLTPSTGHAPSSFASQRLPVGEEPRAKTWQKPGGSRNFPNFSSYMHKSISVHTFDVLVNFNWLLTHTGFDLSLLAMVCKQWLKPHTITFFPCWNFIRQEETAQGDLQFLHGCCRGSLHTTTFLRQLSPTNSLGSTLEKPFMQCLGSLNWKSYK